MNDYQNELSIAKQLAEDAGDIILQYFNSVELNPTIKNDRTIVTQADIKINSHVIKILNKETPGYSIWGEEESSIIKGAEYTWVCDPVDGTMPFSKALPLSTFSLALVNKHGDSVVGVIFDPFQKRLFEAVKDKGAFLNGKRISVSEKANLDDAYISEELWISPEEGITFDSPKDALNKTGSKVTTFCSAVISGCLVAKGDYEGLVFGQGKPEDIAALAVIVTEAGGRVTDLFGKPQRYDTNIKGAIVSNGHIHNEICKMLENLNYTSKFM